MKNLRFGELPLESFAHLPLEKVGRSMRPRARSPKVPSRHRRFFLPVTIHPYVHLVEIFGGPCARVDGRIERPKQCDFSVSLHRVATENSQDAF